MSTTRDLCQEVKDLRYRLTEMTEKGGFPAAFVEQLRVDGFDLEDLDRLVEDQMTAIDNLHRAGKVQVRPAVSGALHNVFAYGYLLGKKERVFA